MRYGWSFKIGESPWFREIFMFIHLRCWGTSWQENKNMMAMTSLQKKTWSHVCTWVCVYVSLCIHMHVYVDARACICFCVHECMCKHICMCVSMHLCDKLEVSECQPNNKVGFRGRWVAPANRIPEMYLQFSKLGNMTSEFWI